MAYANEREAYRRFHAEDAARQRYLRELRRIRLDLESIELDMAESLRKQAEARENRVAALVASLGKDAAFLRTLRAFTGHTPRGWLTACGCDGRMRKLLRDEGWDVLKEVIHRVRYARMWYKHVRDREGGER